MARAAATTVREYSNRLISVNLSHFCATASTFLLASVVPRQELSPEELVRMEQTPVHRRVGVQAVGYLGVRHE